MWNKVLETFDLLLTEFKLAWKYKLGVNPELSKQKDFTNGCYFFPVTSFFNHVTVIITEFFVLVGDTWDNVIWQDVNSSLIHEIDWVGNNR